MIQQQPELLLCEKFVAHFLETSVQAKDHMWIYLPLMHVHPWMFYCNPVNNTKTTTTAAGV
jgi:hypothetical protein